MSLREDSAKKCMALKKSKLSKSNKKARRRKKRPETWLDTHPSYLKSATSSTRASIGLPILSNWMLTQTYQRRLTLLLIGMLKKGLKVFIYS